MVDIFPAKQRRELMSKVKNKDTDIELILRKRLWASGYRYRANYKTFGSPDIAFPGKKIAVFCDGDFWHGRNYWEEKSRYKKFWRDKIITNIKRDRKVNKRLRKEGWIILRFWKTEILKNPEQCVKKIAKYL